MSTCAKPARGACSRTTDACPISCPLWRAGALPVRAYDTTDCVYFILFVPSTIFRRLSAIAPITSLVRVVTGPRKLALKRVVHTQEAHQ